MGRPGYFSDETSFEGAVVNLWLQWVSNVTGGIPTALARAVGFTSVVRTGVGLFTVTLSEPWAMKYLDFQATIQQAAYSAAGACEVQILTDNAATTGVYTIEITNAAGAAVDPTTNDFISLHWTMQSHAPGL